MLSLAAFCGIWFVMLTFLGIMHNIERLIKPEHRKELIIVSLVDVTLGIVAVLAYYVSKVYPKTALADNNIVWAAPWVILIIALPILVYTLPQPQPKE